MCNKVPLLFHDFSQNLIKVYISSVSWYQLVCVGCDNLVVFAYCVCVGSSTWSVSLRDMVDMFHVPLNWNKVAKSNMLSVQQGAILF